MAEAFLFNFGTWDYVIIALYFVMIVYVGFKYSKTSGDAESEKEDFLLAGRKLTLPMFVMTIVATWYGNILGVGEFIWGDGLVGWLCFSFTYYIAAFLFAIFIAGKVRKMNISTIPEQIEKFYGRGASIFSAIIVLVITLPAVYVLSLGEFVKMSFDLDLNISIIIATVISFAYIIKGGFKADIVTNAVQFVLMYLGFFILTYFAVQVLGSPSDMLARLPESHLSLTGNYGIQFIIVWFIIAFQTFVDPGFHQRCSAVSNPKTAKRGVLISILLWMVFDFMTLTTALYARAYFPDLQSGLLSYPVMSNAILPEFFKGFFIVSVLATVMSTLDSYAFISGATIGNDIIMKLPNAKKNAKYWTKIGIVITGIFSILLAIALPSAVQLIYKTSSIAVPGLLFPLVITYFPKYTLKSKHSLLIMISASAISGFWTLMNSLGVHIDFIISDIFVNIEPMVPGIALSIILGLSLIRKKEQCLQSPTL